MVLLVSVVFAGAEEVVEVAVVAALVVVEASDVEASDVVVAGILEGALVVFGLAVVFAVFFAVVFAVVDSCVELSAESALLFKSPFAFSIGRQSFANQTASTVAPPSEHPFEL